MPASITRLNPPAPASIPDLPKEVIPASLLALLERETARAYYLNGCRSEEYARFISPGMLRELKKLEAPR